MDNKQPFSHSAIDLMKELNQRDDGSVDVLSQFAHFRGGRQPSQTTKMAIQEKLNTTSIFTPEEKYILEQALINYHG